MLLLCMIMILSLKDYWHVHHVFYAKPRPLGCTGPG